MTVSVSAQPLTRVFGYMPEGLPVYAVTLMNASEMQVTLISYGAAIQSVVVSDRSGAFRDVTAGHSSIDEYFRWPQYSGATVGRFANRIAGGRFSLDEQEYRLSTNNGPNSLHGGTTGFDRLNWKVEDTGNSSVTFSMVSPDGDQGYPGSLSASALYSLSEDNRLSVEYTATTDMPTIVNLSNHAYWNLAGEGEGSAMGHHLQIFGDKFLPTGIDLIPTGERRTVAGTPFDFRKPKVIDENLRDASDEQIRNGCGYDHNWIIADNASADLRLVARVKDDASGRVMSLSSNQPGLQFYSGNFFDGSSSGKAGKACRMGDFIALEPQMFPDTPNQPDFGSARLDPGQTYRSLIEWDFSTNE